MSTDTRTRVRWDTAARCRQSDVDPDDFFSKSPRAIARAVAVCQLCPVIRECADESRGETIGVWAGQHRG